MPPTVYRRQQQILDFLKQYIESHGYAPTLSQIAQSIGVSSLATVHEHLQAMEKKGLLKRKSGQTRGIDILENFTRGNYNSLSAPILGFIAAGLPIETYTDPNATLNIPSSFVSGKKRVFVLQVRGDSMIEDGILDGDFVIIEQQEDAKNGDIVVALLDNGMATLKRYFKEETRIRLEPANSQMSPIFAKNVRIQGKCVGIIRRY